ncbi:MAG: hypothetical protein IKP77_03885 [Acholeplasmatales bacterium]|nr:hypothetical protein [Acholeplasmatales bacterium]
MQVLRRVLVGLVLCFAFVVVLASCSNVSKSYADKVNDAYKNGNALTYEEVKKDFGDECIDVTINKGQSGLLIAVKGLTAANYKEKLGKASADEKFDFISITVIQGKCTYAHYAESATAAEVNVGLSKI